VSLIDGFKQVARIDRDFSGPYLGRIESSGPFLFKMIRVSRFFLG